MAIRSNIRSKTDECETTYVGCVLRHFEQNGYHDSDFWAEVWDEESGDTKLVEYDTTRCGCWGTAEIDITRENLIKVYRSKRARATKFVDNSNVLLAKQPNVGKKVVVVRGRKVPKGTTGEVFWIGEKYNMYARIVEEIAGIRTDDGQKAFLKVEYLEVVDYDQYIPSGRKRKEQIKGEIISRIPGYLRHMLDPRNNVKAVLGS